jgi:hypothetical protein
MNVAIMQPYIFPYIGYFQLINAVDQFVFYDDVNFIKRGWINRNRILLNGKDALVTIPLIKASQNKLINEINIFFDEKMKKILISKIENAYKKAPYYDEVINLIRKIINADIPNIGEYAANSIISVSNYLEIDTKFYFSSIQSPESKGMDKADRLIYICKNLGADHYINTIGGQVLYSKKYFDNNQIDLSFIKTLDFKYEQFDHPFIPFLSIIDVLMFNSKNNTKEMLTKYQLV